MDDALAKADLHRALRQARAAVLWKLEGLGEYDARRPLTPTGTSVLGLVKHLAHVEAAYFGDAFSRPVPGGPHWADLGDDLLADMWARADEDRAALVTDYRRVAVHADATIEALPLGAAGHVAHWPPERNPVTLHGLLVHVVAETHRHAGHADIVRELVDGAAGLRPDSPGLAPEQEAGGGGSHRDRVDRVERAARDAAARARAVREDRRSLE